MTVIQENKNNIRQVLYYKELKQHLVAFTANADVCTHKLREWRQKVDNIFLLDLRKAYIQVHIHNFR